MKTLRILLALLMTAATTHAAIWNCCTRISKKPTYCRPTREETIKRLERLHELRHPSSKSTPTVVHSAWTSARLAPAIRNFNVNFKLTPKDKDYYLKLVQEAERLSDQVKETIYTIESNYSQEDEKKNISPFAVKDYLRSDEFKNSDTGKKIISSIKNAHDFLVAKLPDLENQPRPSGPKISDTDKEKINKKIAARVDMVKNVINELATFSQNYFNSSLTTTNTTSQQHHLTRKEEKKIWQKEQRKKKKQPQQQTPQKPQQIPTQNQQPQQIMPPTLPASLSPQLKQELITLLNSIGQNPTQQQIQQYQQSLGQFMQKLNPQQQQDLQQWFQQLQQQNPNP